MKGRDNMIGHIGMYQGMTGINLYGFNNVRTTSLIGASDGDSAIGVKNPNKKSPIDSGKCETCENRRYQDVSNEQVSFKTPGKIRPQEAYSKVMGHEKEHVANAVAESSKPSKELVSASVSLKTDICPECGKSYISGGTTTTIMKTYKGDAYSQNRKSYEAESLKGNNVDLRG